MLSKIPSGLVPSSREALYALFPEITLTPLQEKIKEWMGDLYEKQPTYKWENSHSGVTEEVVVDGKTVAVVSQPPKVYCCGLSFEMWWKVHTYLCAKHGKEQPFSFEEVKEIYKHCFVFDEGGVYDQGFGTGGKAYQEMLTKHGLPWKVHVHTSIENANFGDFVQMRNKENIHSPGGGHSFLFVGMVEETFKGKSHRAVRGFQAEKPSYGLTGGINLSWFMKAKETEGFQRMFYIASIEDVEESSEEVE